MAEKLTKFERDLIEAVKDMKSGTSVPMPTLAKGRRGRPPQEVTKVAVKLRLDRDLVEELRNTGPGWQTRANAALRREFLQPTSTATVSIFESAPVIAAGARFYPLAARGAAGAAGYPFNLSSGITL